MHSRALAAGSPRRRRTSSSPVPRRFRHDDRRHLCQLAVNGIFEPLSSPPSSFPVHRCPIILTQTKTTAKNLPEKIMPLPMPHTGGNSRCDESSLPPTAVEELLNQKQQAFPRSASTERIKRMRVLLTAAAAVLMFARSLIFVVERAPRPHVDVAARGSDSAGRTEGRSSRRLDVRSSATSTFGREDGWFSPGTAPDGVIFGGCSSGDGEEGTCATRPKLRGRRADDVFAKEVEVVASEVWEDESAHQDRDDPEKESGPALANEVPAATTAEGVALSSTTATVKVHPSFALTDEEDEEVSLVFGSIAPTNNIELTHHPAIVSAFSTAQRVTNTSIQPRPLVIAGPSGVGKGTLIDMLLQFYAAESTSHDNAAKIYGTTSEYFGFSVSHTTRAPRPGEVNGTHYHFIDREVMLKQIEEGQFVEHAEVHGNLYGTSFNTVQFVMKSGRICVLDIDVQGVRGVKASQLDPYYVFIAPPSMEELETRLKGRGTENEEAILVRTVNVAAEVEYGTQGGNFDRVIVNGDKDAALSELINALEGWYPHLRDIAGLRNLN
mmetsp:Transcript_19277/g.36001  ORF Transcript_19277/g.36001 Transcript_19277/m.36001 type:complete len:552 (-) Transcript_19277:899-2554(-)